jgi:acid phosphatase (class A)
MEKIDDFFYEEKSKYHKKYVNKPTPFFKNGWKNIKLIDFPKNSSKETEKEINHLKDLIANVKPHEKKRILEQDSIEEPFEFKFLDIVEEKDKEAIKYFDELIYQIFSIVIHFKDKFKRLRPEKVAKLLKINYPKITTKSGVTPSYPSGHTVVSYFLAEVLSKKYPKYKKELFDFAKECAENRMKLGVHFPSDIAAGKVLATELLKYYKDSNKILGFKEWVQLFADNS